MSVIKDISGQTFGLLTAKKYSHSESGKAYSPKIFLSGLTIWKSSLWKMI